MLTILQKCEKIHYFSLKNFGYFTTRVHSDFENGVEENIWT